ncbi:MAG: NAD-dependent succinate-semialdehyde dehydrogenase [Cellulomonadaceae bacterium]|nr:NAD-dependent succinate-semialdehyde dehydrogenase [Cellulomonadaceae bacterium]
MTQPSTLPESRLLIDGQWITAGDRATIDVENPANKAVIGAVPVATAADIDAALESSARANTYWRDTNPYERAAIIQRAAALLRDQVDDIAAWMTLENGKHLGDSRGEVLFTADIMDSMAADAPRRFGTVIPGGASDGLTLVVPEPIGPIAAFTTWNYPVTVPARKLAAALAAGCTVIIKPAEETPASAIAVVEALVDAGLPAGVVNMLFGDPAQISSTLIASPVIRKVSFTGSTPVGKHLAALAGAQAKPIMLELGGHAPVIVFDDADVEAVAHSAFWSKLHNAAQSCGAPTRFFVQQAIYQRFIDAYAALLQNAVVADGFTDGVQQAPLASQRRFDAMKPLIDDAVAKGARIVAGGTGDDSVGYYFQPTLLADVPADADIMQEEPFGPISVVTPFTDEDEVVARANDVAYGLAAFCFTADASRALRMPRRLDFGMVSVNKFGVGGRDTFFGGRKESGFGSEGGPEALDEYLTKKLIVQA